MKSAEADFRPLRACLDGFGPLHYADNHVNKAVQVRPDVNAGRDAAIIMATTLRRNERSRRVLVVTVGVCALLSFAIFAWVYGTTYVAYWSYQPLEGDILFQSLPHSPLVDAIEGVTASPYSHCGIVAKEHGRWIVYEAFHNVEAIPLKQFLFRGRDLRFAVYRLKSPFQQYVPATIANAKTYLGRPYDVRYRMDDERIYCSELI